VSGLALRWAKGAYDGYLCGEFHLAPGRQEEFLKCYRICCQERHKIIMRLVDRVVAYSEGALRLPPNPLYFDPLEGPRLQIHLLVEQERFLVFSVHSVSGVPIFEVASSRAKKEIDFCLLDCGIGIPHDTATFCSNQTGRAVDAERSLTASRNK
jgi:hypothetical protein